MIKGIVDTGIGVDDALALMMAIGSPALDVLGITTVGGNASLARTSRNALSLMEHVAVSDIPVRAGPDGPTVRLPGPRSAPVPHLRRSTSRTLLVKCPAG